MPLLKELKLIVKSLVIWLGLLIVATFTFFLFPNDKSVAVLALLKIKEELLPVGVQLIVTNPLDAFLNQILVSLLLAFVFILPIFFYGLIRYLSPALFKRERWAVIKVSVTSFVLFLVGCAFAYLFIIPATFKILYTFTSAIEVMPFFSLSEFISLSLSLMLATGVMFLLPVFMAMLAYLGLVGSTFWRENWRFVFIFFLTFSAIITPDGTGITMMMLFLPFVGLYLLGYIIIKKVEGKRLNHLK